MRPRAETDRPWSKSLEKRRVAERQGRRRVWGHCRRLADCAVPHQPHARRVKARKTEGSTPCAAVPRDVEATAPSGSFVATNEGHR